MVGFRPFNMTVTNVPGPQIPIYMLGSKLVAQYPMVPLYADHGIGVALFSYDGEIDWGLSADYDLVPDLDRFVIAIEDALDELHAAATKAEKKAITAEKRRATAAKKRAAAAKKSPPPKRPATAKRPAAKKAPAKKAQAES